MCCFLWAKIRKKKNTETLSQEDVKADLSIQHVHTKVTECRLEEMVFRTVLEQGTVHRIGSNLGTQKQWQRWCKTIKKKKNV